MKTIMKIYSRIILFLLFTAVFSQTKNVNFDLKLDPQPVGAGENVSLIIDFSIGPGFHIYSTNPDNPFPTSVVFADSNLFSNFGKIAEPTPHVIYEQTFEQNVESHEGAFQITQTLTVNHKLVPGEYKVEGTLSYLSCDEIKCVPKWNEFSLEFVVIEGNPDRIVNSATIEEEVPPTSSTMTQEERDAKEILEKGILIAMLIFFGFGIALNLTPCVYPVIPITISYFGSQSEHKKGSTFNLAIFYTLGIAIVFALLGLVSSLAGKQWGFLFQSSWFVVAIVMIMLIFSLSMFGVFEVKVPTSIMTKAGASREGLLGSFIMGLTVGFVIAPCAAGIIVGLIGLVAREGIILKGTLLFFVMGLGLGLPYLILGTFSGLLNKLPQSGMWMVWIKKVFGIILIGVAIYFLLPQIGEVYDKQSFVLGVLTIFSGIYLGFLDRAPGYTLGFKRTIKLVGLGLIIFGFVLTNNGIHSKASEINWIKYNSESISELQKNGNPIIFDFYTDFCAPCKKMDRETFKDDRIEKLSNNFVMVKVNMTKPDDELNLFAFRFKVTGYPSIIFIDKDGIEITNLSSRGGYVGADKFYENMKQAE